MHGKLFLKRGRMLFRVKKATMDIIKGPAFGHQSYKSLVVIGCLLLVFSSAVCGDFAGTDFSFSRAQSAALCTALWRHCAPFLFTSSLWANICFSVLLELQLDFWNSVAVWYFLLHINMITLHAGLSLSLSR